MILGGVFIVLNKKSHIPVASQNSVSQKAPDSSDSASLSNEKSVIPNCGENISISKNKDHVFLGQQMVDGADPDSLRRVSSGNQFYGTFLKDKNHVYFMPIALGISIVKDADPLTFEIMKGLYAKDKKHVFALHCFDYESRCGERLSIIQDADPASFIVFNENYAKDKNYVYSYSDKYFRPEFYDMFYVAKIYEADLKSFVPLSEYFAKDSKHIFFKDQLISGAEMSSFVIVGDDSPSSRNPKYSSSYAKDNNSVFSGAQKVEGANPATFTTQDIPQGE